MDQAVALQRRGLHGALARQPQGTLPAPHLVGVVEGLGGVAVRQQSPDLVEQEEPCDEQEFTDEGRPRYRGGPFFGRLGVAFHPRPFH
ncbi:hypothetical protein GCM10017771_90400 [Streptomyces capitiformicae]|uniref:Uncharacterized protein n=1 Tax=Streptomyces capitiformicae TaxID=2014920 RepID=A0A919DQI8_9ACTN|nr:hypothetical protein GCM10017771_90400 [Streptomyces capitiformicae]